MKCRERCFRRFDLGNHEHFVGRQEKKMQGNTVDRFGQRVCYPSIAMARDVVMRQEQ